MKSKNRSRLGHISNNFLRQIVISGFNMVIPFMVVYYCEKELWGSFVPMLLFTLMALQFVNWGNKEYQLRQFSQSPNKISSNYSISLAARFPMVVLFAGFGFFYYSPIFAFYITLWICGRFLNHSVEALIIYDKKFNISILIETCSFIFFCIAFFFQRTTLDLLLFLKIYSIYQFLKGASYFLLFSKYVSFRNMSFSLRYYHVALPFFLLSIMGFLASKVDVYLIARLGNKIATANYQVINSLLVFIISISAFIYVPFTKNLYRNSDNVIHKTRQILLISGLTIVPIALVAVYFILKFYLNLQLPFIFYVVAFAYILPAYAYGIEIVNLFRIGKEKTVVLLLFIGVVANTSLSVLFIYYGYGILGALTGSAIAQNIVLILFRSGPPWKTK